MKFFVPNLKLGSQIQGSVQECLSNNEIIISFQGDLMKVKNKSGCNFKNGDKILLKVINTTPLQFQIIKQKNKDELKDKNFDIRI